jgi:ubiquinone/menaquinone biosynthesis C-methylase UbiE
MSRTLTYLQARRFYDRLGSGQDTQASYEAPALEELIRHAQFETASSVVEFGVGTGRLAARLLSDFLPSTALYRGLDLSPTMVRLASERLARWGERAHVLQTDGTIRLPFPDSGVDRVITTYVLDLLSDSDIRQFIREAHRVLVSGGLLAIACLTPAFTPGARVLQAFWSALFRLHPAIVGGCRPLQLDTYLRAPAWEICHSGRVVRLGMPSQVIVARAVGPAPPIPTA